MKKLILLTYLTLFTINANAQNTVVNQTERSSLANIVEQGLNKLNITDIHVSIIKMSPKLYKQLRNTGRHTEAVTISANKGVYTIILNHPTKQTWTQLIAHELIHIKQKYQGINYDENPSRYEHQAEIQGLSLAQRLY